MRIIAGRLRRRTFKAPDDLSTRPTTDRVRESIFNVLEARIDFHGLQVLDLFAGTGALGFEAISRGASFVTFVEQNSKVVKIARENAEALGIADQGSFLRGDAVAFLERTPGPRYGLVFADPPYELEAMDRMPELAQPHLAPGGLFVLEHSKAHTFDDHPRLVTSRRYGRTVVSVFRDEVEGPES
ncbi:MAG: 16S rRNA (guanine(966)-N(2))-methyltransferase RsmD [Bacteroidota bacterium]